MNPRELRLLRSMEIPFFSFYFELIVIFHFLFKIARRLSDRLPFYPRVHCWKVHDGLFVCFGLYLQINCKLYCGTPKARAV